MKYIVTSMLIALTFLQSCSSNHAFVHQKYTNFGHCRHHGDLPETENIFPAGVCDSVQTPGRNSDAHYRTEENIRSSPGDSSGGETQQDPAIHNINEFSVTATSLHSEKMLQLKSAAAQGKPGPFLFSVLGVALIFFSVLYLIGFIAAWWPIPVLAALLLFGLLFFGLRKTPSGTTKTNDKKSNEDSGDGDDYSQEEKESADQNIRVLGFLAAVFAFASIVAMVLGVAPLAAMILLTITMAFLLLQGTWLARVNNRKANAGEKTDPSVKERTSIAFTLAAVTFVVAVFWLIVKFL